MSLSFLLRQSNAEALNLSQTTNQYLQERAFMTFPISSLSLPESTDLWLVCEKLFLSSLRTGDDKAAFNCLDKLVKRFGATNERVLGLRGLYQEAVAKDDVALETILREYNEVLAENTTNIVSDY